MNEKIKITYIDDLTYNHENSDMKFYRIIKKFNKLPISYFGYDEIRSINRKLHDSQNLNEFSIFNK